MWILPTLNRPEQCAQVVQRLVQRGAAARGVVLVNGKENAKRYWDEVFPSIPDNWLLLVEDKNIGALGALNAVLADFPNEPWYGFVGDDEFVETTDFEEKLISAAGAWDIAHGDDGVHRGERAQSALVIGGKLARAVGYLAIPECWHWYGLDDMWESLAKAGACRKVFVPEVKVDHRHPYFGKGERDETYALGESRKDIDYQIYASWMRYKFKDVVLRVKKARSE